MTTISDESIRWLAKRIEERDGVTPQVALQRAAKWAAKQILKGTPFDEATKTFPGPHGRSIRCQCTACKAWRDDMDKRSAKSARAYSASSGGW